MNSVITKAFVSELTKIALIERLVRLGATDIPNTPRMLMRHRSPQELGQLQSSVTSLLYNNVKKPIMGVAEKGLTKLPAGKVQSAARTMAETFATDPVGTTLSAVALPIPGAEALYVGGKKVLERGIDKAFPLRK